MTPWFFAPLPPARSGVARHAAELLRVIGRLPSRRNLYHLGNNQLHAEIYRRAMAEPGVIVLHDAVLHHFLLGSLSRHEYIEEFVYNYGEWTRELAERLWAERSRSAADARYFEYPMLKRICERSDGVVVHNPAAARIVRGHSPASRVFEIPLLHAPTESPGAADAAVLRRELRIDPLQFVCGIFGYLRESKRIDVAVRACAEAEVTLVVAGECAPELEQTLKPYLQQPHVRRVPYLRHAQYRTLTTAVDCCINLRYPRAGETSAVGLDLMAQSKPVVFTESQESARYPKDACARIESGPGERENLRDVLLWFKRFRSDAEWMGARAANHIREQHSPDRVAALFAQVLC